MGPGKKKPSFRDVAKLSKVSLATVSRVARGHVSVDPGIREQVSKAARQLGLDLQQRLNGTSKIIAFILSNRDVLNSFHARVLLGAENYCSQQNRELLFITYRYSATVPPKDLPLPQILSQRTMVRAAILGGTNSPNMLEALRAHEVPFAVLGNNVLGDWEPDKCDAVYSDDIQGAFDLTRQLITDGHRDIWFIGDVELPWYARCAQGYKSAMKEHGLRPRMSQIHSDDYELGYLGMRSILSRGEPVTAVFAGSDPVARGVYEALQQAGLSVPGFVSVAGFNDSGGDMMAPRLTTVREFPEELGKHLAEFVLNRIQRPDLSPQILTIPTRVIVRDSTRPLAPTAGPSPTDKTLTISP